MLLFRSEEDVDKWALATGNGRGASVPLKTVWELGQVWYRDRLEAEFRGFSAERVRETFARFGLTSESWQVP